MTNYRSTYRQANTTSPAVPTKPATPTQKVRILSIDGGGIRGVIPATILNYIEKTLQNKTGNLDARLCDFFDLIVGTSTGGYLNLSEDSGLPMTAEEVLYILINQGRESQPDEDRKMPDYPLCSDIMMVSLTTGSAREHDGDEKMKGKAAKNHYRLNPDLRKADPTMDNASEENIKALHRAGLQYIAENHLLLDEIIDKLIDEA
jgi:hypothetical protein